MHFSETAQDLKFITLRLANPHACVRTDTCSAEQEVFFKY